MRQYRPIYGAALAVVLLVGWVALRPSAAQDDLIPEQQTVQAAVESLFTATAQAEAYSTFALTVDAAFHLTQTATRLPSRTPEPTGVISTPENDMTASPTATPEDVATLTDQARLLTATVAGPETATALFAAVPGWAVEVGGELVRVDGGTFEMGTTPQEITAAVNQCVNVEGGNCLVAFGEDSLPQHTVTVSAFQIERTEVTYRQYRIFLTALGAGSHLNGCSGQPCVVTRRENENSSIAFDGFLYQVAEVIENLPVASVTWFGAEAYCRVLGRRLPTEAEWERAARGPDNLLYPWGDTWEATLAKTSISPDETIGALPVGSLPAGSSPFGAFDMAGNVAEWVSDWYDPAYYSSPAASSLNPTGPRAGVDKVVRGGSWDAKPFFARSVHRQSAIPQGGYLWIGFRCAADIEAGMGI